MLGRGNVASIVAAHLLALLAARDAAANTFTITPSGFTAWNISVDGAPAVANPTLTLQAGQSYTFNVTASTTHPFWIKTVQGIGTANGYTGGGLSQNGVTMTTTITFDVPSNAPATLFYNCANHSGMTGTIEITPDVVFANGFE